MENINFIELNFIENGVFLQRVEAACPKYITIGLARCTLQQWEDYNPVLYPQELGFILDTKEFIIGDGITPFKDLKRYKFVEVLNNAN